MKTLFIRNLPFDASETDLRKAFEAYGRVHRCSIAKNRETGESRGFGFVDMDDEPATKAISEMNGRMFSNRTIVVQESDPKARAAGPGPAGPGGPRPPMGAGGPPRTNFSQNGPRPPGSGPMRSGPYQSRTAGPPANRNFGPPASPAAERNRQYQEKKDRLKPYKRDHFDFREALDEEEENAARRRKDADGTETPPGDAPPATPPVTE